MNHDYRTPEACDCKGAASCMVCDGGLSICRVCGLYEGSLTTECPGVPSYAERAEDVYAGRVDFRAGQWVPEVSIHMAHAYPDHYRAPEAP